MTKSKNILLTLLALPLFCSTAGHAGAVSQTQSAPPSVAIYVDGAQLHPEAAPLNIKGTVLVPMRSVFEKQGAKLSWDNQSKTVTATKGGATLIYRMGDSNAKVNGATLKLTVPGRITAGYSMIPLRFVSEALGSKVAWEQAARSVRITSAANYNTSIEWGVTLRTAPDATSSPVQSKMLAAGTKVHVIREVGAYWLEVRTQDNMTGYISAKPKYTDYTSPSLLDKQADALLAYGKTFLGKPYEFGASPEQTDTFDCSSFVKRLFADTLSVDLPRVSYDQAKEGVKVGLNELRPGDLLFFSARGLDIGHVGIYAGNNQILHTYSKKEGVHIEAFDGQWKERFVTARRML